MRIYELARQLEVKNKEILDKLPELGIVAKSHASSLTPEQSRKVVGVFKPELLEKTVADMPTLKQNKAPKVAKVAPETPAAKTTKPKTERPIRERKKRRRRPEIAEPNSQVEPEVDEEPDIIELVIREGVTVKELAEKMEQETSAVIKALMGLGVMATINQRIPVEVAEVVATEFGCKVETEELYKSTELEEVDEQDNDKKTRPPVVTVMGHVDHGKTLLLDTIRNANVVDKEAGGITQHIGAYSVETKNGTIAFIDTPGHEAFTAMRARGTDVTDMVILVVAADDGVMPQTEEALHHAQAAGVPIIVAVNKCDLPAANPDKVKQQLSERNLAPEDWGGDTIYVDVSAKTGDNVDKLLEMVLLQAEMLELKASYESKAKGVVIEARLDKGQGALATVLVQQGVLKVGSSFVCGRVSGKVKALMGANNERMKEAGPATPVVLLGFNEMPNVGDVLQETTDEKEARRVATQRVTDDKASAHLKAQKLTLEALQKQLAGEQIKELGVIVKADASGSVEALRDALERIDDDRVSLKVLHGAVGAVTDTDINLAAASSAMIVAFNVRPTTTAQKLAKHLEVEIRSYSIIYNLIDDITSALEGLLDPELKETSLGRAEVRETFRVSKTGMIAGCYVQDGQIKRNAKIRVVRDGTIIYTGKINSLRRFKDDVKEVGTNFECGIGIENFNDVKVSDILEVFEVTEQAQTLNI